MDLRGAFSGHGDRAVVVEAERGDSVSLLAFKSAVEGGLPGTVRDIVEQAYHDVTSRTCASMNFKGVKQ